MIAQPFIYEINTWPWLAELGTDLAGVPDDVWDSIADLGFDAVWLMGVWRRSPAGIARALDEPAVAQSFQDVLPDFTVDDVAGSAYCIRDYQVDERLGGTVGLVAARKSLAERGLSLILDFVPNHVAPDHPWIRSNPEYFITGSVDDLRDDPESFVEIGGTVFANGRDPYFPAWRDVVQLNTFSPALRNQVAQTLLSIAEQCDGVRCDMAMLPLDDVVTRTWGERAGNPPADGYWPTAIAAVRRVHPDFVFIAEAYWDLESRLQEQGFDYCYDKRLYDSYAGHEGADAVRARLSADTDHQRGLIRFLENHDEPRAASTFGADEHKAVAVATLTGLGAKLIYDGQLSGAVRRVPVHLGRGPVEEVDKDLAEFYLSVLGSLRDPVWRTGDWAPCDITGWEGNTTSGSLLAWTRRGESRWLVVVNLSDSTASGTVATHWDDLRGSRFRLVDTTRDLDFLRSGDDVCDGMFIELDPWLWHLFRIDETETTTEERV
ncbi:alpha-amylase family glycosyl hydrolase [Williamsia sp.]|uniref:alpha-amylase family glycosyl hydrolase n=1 Tax=Williamsia sp. TaxID=1872085 RepID=UPI002F93B56B